MTSAAFYIDNLLKRVERLEVLEDQGNGDFNTWKNGILLIPQIGDIVVYPKTSAGMDDASAAAVAGDLILFPFSGEIPDSHTLTPGVYYVSLSRGAFYLSGEITGSNNSVMENMWIYRFVNTANTEVGFQGPAAGTAFLKNCAVQVFQQGTGDARGMQINAGNVDTRLSHFTGQILGGGGGPPVPPVAPGLLPGQIFPADNIWNKDISALGVHASSGNWISHIGIGKLLHPYFGPGTYLGGPIGIPITVVPAGQAIKTIDLWTYDIPADEFPLSPGLHLHTYPIPDTIELEYLSDHHGIIVQLDGSNNPAKLYELYKPVYHGDGTWGVGSSAWWDLTNNDLRDDDYTSADAAGLPIGAGLVTWDEIDNGAINHALRVNMPWVRNSGHIWPARHDGAGVADANYPPYGARLRLKNTTAVNDKIALCDAHIQIICTCLQTYGMIIADQVGGDNYMQLSGPPDESFDTSGGLSKTDIQTDLHRFRADDFDFVDESGLIVDPDSGESL